MKFLNVIDGADKLITDANNRLVTDTDISNWNNKSDKGHKHTKNEITDFPVSLPANGGNADTVGGKSPSDFTLQSYTDSNIYPVNNVAISNLGRPTVTEMALIDSQATNKIWFYPLDKMIFEESDDGITFSVRSDISDTDKRRLVSGNSNASISIPKGKYFRITIFPRSYVYLNWIYMYFSTSGNSARFKCEKKRDDGDWITHFDYTNLVSGWPGHIFIPHSTIAFSPNSTSGHYNQVRITIATEEQTNQYPNMTLYGLEWWGGYPRGSRDIFSYDEYQNVTFPEELKAKTYKNASGKEVAYQDDIPTKLSELNKDINFDERYYTKSETYTKTEVNTKLDEKVDKISGKGLSTEDYTSAEKTKLSGIEAGAEVNQNAFSNIKVGTTTIAADSKTDTLELTAGTGITLTPDATNDKVTVSVASAPKLTTARTISLSGDVSGSTSFDGSANVTITATVADDSHNHVISNIDGLQAALDAKETPSGAQTKADSALASAKNYTDAKVAGVVNSAPEALDTLYELAEALGNDPNFATTVMTEIGTKETPAGAQAKANQAEQNAKNYTDSELVAHAKNATLNQLGHVNHAVLTTTLNTSWSGSSAPYTKTISVSGILATDTPFIDIVMSGTYATDTARQEAWGYIYRAVTADNAITFYATDKPTVSLPLQIKVVR